MKKTFTIRCHDRVLVVEDNPERILWFREKLPRATLVRHPLLAIDALRARPFDVVMLDADLPCPQNLTGVDVAKCLVRSRFRGRVLIHSYNQRAVREMKRLLKDAMAYEFGDFEIMEARR
jgi:CheY-like chemotaxis protein